MIGENTDRVRYRKLAQVLVTMIRMYLDKNKNVEIFDNFERNEKPLNEKKKTILNKSSEFYILKTVKFDLGTIYFIIIDIYDPVYIKYSGLWICNIV